jgi:hypothetical protein
MKKENIFRIVAIICLIIFSFTLVSCGNNNAAAPNQPQNKVINTTPAQQVTQTPVTPVEKPKVIESKITGSGPNGEGIKGHIDNKGVKIYHLPGDPYYNRTTHVAQWFFTTKDAESAGYRAILR